MSGGEMIDLLVDQAERLFGDLIDRDRLAAVEDGRGAAALASAVEDFGVTAALSVPSSDGGLSFADAGRLFTLLGAHAVPLPLGETMLATAALVRAGIEPPAGAIALHADALGSTAFAVQFDHVVVQRDGQLVLARSAAGQPVASISRQPRAVLAVGEEVARAAWPSDLPDPLTLGAMLRASQIAGAVGRVLAMAVDHANTRQQFGRPIGRFQAVQQLLAQLAAEAAAVASAADTVWAALDAGAVGWTGAVAKIRAGEGAHRAATIAHQVLGAIGVTDEHLLHYFTRRLWEWRRDFGSDAWWAERLGRAAREANAGLWSFLVTQCAAAPSGSPS